MAEGDLTLVRVGVVILYHRITGYLTYRQTVDIICFHIPLLQPLGNHVLSDEVHWFETMHAVEFSYLG